MESVPAIFIGSCCMAIEGTPTLTCSQYATAVAKFCAASVFSNSCAALRHSPSLRGGYQFLAWSSGKAFGYLKQRLVWLTSQNIISMQEFSFIVHQLCVRGFLFVSNGFLAFACLEEIDEMAEVMRFHLLEADRTLQQHQASLLAGSKTGIPWHT